MYEHGPTPAARITAPPLSAPPMSISKVPPPVPEKTMSFTDRRKLFEQQSFSKPVSSDANMRRKKISLVSDQDLGTLKREERKKRTPM